MLGIEREHRNVQGAHAIGVRTFVILGLLGALAGAMMQPLISFGIVLFVSAAIIASYFRTSDRNNQGSDVGLTTELAAGATFALGFLVHEQKLLTAILGVLILVTLLSREKLHQFTRSQLKASEVQSAATLIVLGVGVLPLLPDQYLDPWQLINLHTYMLTVVVIGTIQFLGYAIVRIFGSHLGYPVTGFMAGLVSSTAAFVSLPQILRTNPAMWAPAASAAILSTISSFVKLVVIVFLVSPALVLPIFLPLAISCFVGLIAVGFLSKSSTKEVEYPTPDNPLSLSGAIRFGSMLAVFLAGVRLIEHLFGAEGTQIVSFLGGLGELHGVSLAAATLFADGKVLGIVAFNSIMLASLASLISKLVITLVVSRKRYMWVVLAVTVAQTLTLMTPWLWILLTKRLG